MKDRPEVGARRIEAREGDRSEPIVLAARRTRAGLTSADPIRARNRQCMIGSVARRRRRTNQNTTSIAKHEAREVGRPAERIALQVHPPSESDDRCVAPLVVVDPPPPAPTVEPGPAPVLVLGFVAASDIGGIPEEPAAP